MSRPIAACCCLLVSLTCLPVIAAARYTVTDLGLPPGMVSAQALDVNAAGTVVGAVYNAGGADQAFVWSNGTMRLLGFLPRGSHSIALAINDSGAIVGDSDTSNAEPRAVIWTNGTATSIKDLTNGLNGANLNALDINASGVVAGAHVDSGSGHGGVWEAVTWSPPYNGSYVALGAIPGSEPGIGFTYAQAINDSGTVAGWASINSTTGQHGWRHTNAGYDVLGLTNVDGAQNSYAYGINAGGDVVGYVSATVWNGTQFVSSNRAFIAVGDTMTDLGLLPGFTSCGATSINGRREIVGYLLDDATSTMHAMLRIGTRLFDLNSMIAPGSGWTLQQATSINEHGQIAGFGLVGGQTRAFLLTPTAGPGTIGGSLVAARHAGDPTRVDLSWGATCGASATDYAVYEGQAGAWSSHEPDACTTLGATHASVTAGSGNRFFLVVPTGGGVEGSYGTDSDGNERARSAHPCAADSNPNRCP